MGQQQSTRLIAENESVSRLEMYFSARTLGTSLSSSLGSRPSIVNTTLQNTMLTITVSEGDFPVTGIQPEAAIHFLLRCIQDLPGIEIDDWKPKNFVSHISSVELITQSSVSLTVNDEVRLGSTEMFVRVHYQDDEPLLRNLLAFFAARMVETNNVILKVRPRGYDDVIAHMSFNFTPNEVNITSESQLRDQNASQSKDRPNKTLGSSALSSIGDLGNL